MDLHADLEAREQIGPQIRPCPGTGFSGPRVDRKHAVECTSIGLLYNIPEFFFINH